MRLHSPKKLTTSDFESVQALCTGIPNVCMCCPHPSWPASAPCPAVQCRRRLKAARREERESKMVLRHWMHSSRVIAVPFANSPFRRFSTLTLSWKRSRIWLQGKSWACRFDRPWSFYRASLLPNLSGCLVVRSVGWLWLARWLAAC